MNVFADKNSLKAAVTAFNNDETTAKFTSKAALMTAVQAFNANPTAATATYGPVAEWDVSKITDMSWLFQNLKNFNADISNWNTSSVTTMYEMFYGASAFNQPLSFDTSSVTDMSYMFDVRFRLRLLPSLPSRATHARRVRC